MMKISDSDLTSSDASAPPPAAAAAVKVCGLAKTFGRGSAAAEALHDVDLTLSRGEFVAIMGPSGSGKSTLLHAIAGLIAPTRGHITLDTHRLGELDDDAVTLLRRRRVGFVFQAFFLVEVLTARENIALPLVLDGVDESTANRRAEALLERLGLSGRGGHLPAQLSGGEKQRVAIARAIVHQPLLLLADEPTGNLDSTSGAEVMRLLRDCVDTERVSVLMVTHDIRCAAHADRIVRLRDGRVVADQKLSGSRTPSDVLRMLGEGW